MLDYTVFIPEPPQCVWGKGRGENLFQFLPTVIGKQSMSEAHISCARARVHCAQMVSISDSIP